MGGVVIRRATSALRGTGEETAARKNPMIGRTLGNFQIVAEIGAGGMGTVYLAQHRGLPKQFAIKSLSKALSGDPNFNARFFAEARRQAILDHPNIVQVTDFFEEAGEFFLVMEYVDGQDLSRLIKSKGKLAEAEALAIFRDILKGLGFAHAKGLVHRDIKPSNVLVDKGGRARVMDFGIAIMTSGTDKSRTATGSTMGSPWYMSPEQILRPREVDQRADIYSLGIVLYEMLTGGVPFDAETDFGVKDQQVRSPAKDPREKSAEISGGVAQIVLKAMAKDPGERFQNCAELASAIDAAQKGSAKPPSRLLIAALTAILVTSAGTIAYFVAQGLEPKRQDRVVKPQEATSKSPELALKPPAAVPKPPEVVPKPPDAAPKPPGLPGEGPGPGLKGPRPAPASDTNDIQN